MKLCIDCKYYSKSSCKHLSAVRTVNPVNGNITFTIAGYMREDIDHMFNMPRCGIDAKLYEEKEPSLLTRMMFWKKSTHKPD